MGRKQLDLAMEEDLAYIENYLDIDRKRSLYQRFSAREDFSHEDYFDPDGNEPTVRQLIATLENVPALTARDISPI